MEGKTGSGDQRVTPLTSREGQQEWVLWPLLDGDADDQGVQQGRPPSSLLSCLCSPGASGGGTAGSRGAAGGSIQISPSQGKAVWGAEQK